MKSKGVTLIELIVAVGIFAIFISVIFGFFVVVIRIQKRVLARQGLLDKTSYVLEYMNRALRMAVMEEADENVPDCIEENANYKISGNAIRFLKYEDPVYICEQFFWDPVTFVLKEQKSIDNTEAGFVGIIPVELTPPDIKIEDFKPIVYNDVPSADDKGQARVTILLKAASKTSGSPAINLQTSVSQRNPNVK